MIKAVIFDRDGVLLDSEYANLEATNLALQLQNVFFDEDDKKEVVAMHPDEYTQHFVDKYSINSDKFKEDQYKFYLDIYEKTPFIPGMIELIKFLEGKYKLAITTSSNLETTKQFIKRAGIEEAFDKVITNEFYNRKKPFPDPYIVTAEKLEVKPSECVVIEDSEIGVMAAKKAGMICLAKPNEYTKEHDFSLADKVVTNISEIKKYLSLN